MTLLITGLHIYLHTKLHPNFLELYGLFFFIFFDHFCGPWGQLDNAQHSHKIEYNYTDKL